MTFINKYGKISFVDLAGSERLKETESKGEMIKETGNINKSLFTLGKVISCLSSKKGYVGKHIPYRDSKLTMLLMDSLGGSSKALMIACISPSETYVDESQSTLNYATRTMNIKNKPVIRMDQKEQIKFNLKREVQLLRLQNNFLRQELTKHTGDPHIQVPDVAELQIIVGGGTPQDHGMFPSINDRKLPSQVSQSFDTKNDGKSGFKMMNRDYQNEIKGNSALNQLDNQLSIVRQENAQMRYQSELISREFESMMYENNNLYSKLANLEKVFIGESVTSELNGTSDANESESDSGYSGKNYSHGLLVTENNELRERIEAAEQDKIELKGMLINLESDSSTSTTPTGGASELDPESMKRVLQLNEVNNELEKKIELLQSREQHLTEKLLEGYPKPGSSASGASKTSGSSYMRFKSQMTNNNR
jgi:kinesin family protein 12